ncbi:MAG: MiaB/RimO family radical SAM methylthiotransferase [Gemmatimonadaceae bacterium]
MNVYLRTFGCRANQYDSETIRAMVQRAGGSVVDRPEDADVAVFNSCAVTTEAEVELRKGIRGAARRRPELTTLVMGCAASLDTGVLQALPTVSHVVPGADFTAIAVALGLPVDALGAAALQSGTRALLRIQDGCDEHCTFCATTLARGNNRSRTIDDLVREAQVLAERHSELVLTGIHIGTWGQDIGSSLGVLVGRLLRDVTGVRFRLSSIEATEVDDRLRELLDEPDRLVPHIHAPLQSGSDRVLKRMGRHWYTATSYTAALERLVAGRPVFGLGADVIAGFPGETDEDHAATLSLIDSLPFTYLHVFPYSVRPGTAAERLPGRLTGPVIQERARQLRALAEQKAGRYLSRRVGTGADVIVVRGDVREGLTEDYLVVTIGGATPARGARLPMLLQQGTHGRLLATPLVPATA